MKLLTKCKNIIQTDKFKKIFNISTYIIFSILTILVLLSFITNITKTIDNIILGKKITTSIIIFLVSDLLVYLAYMILSVIIFIKKKVSKGLIIFDYSIIIALILILIDNKYHLSYYGQEINKYHLFYYGKEINKYIPSIYFNNFSIGIIIAMLGILILLFLYLKLNQKEENIQYRINKKGNLLINLFNIFAILPMTITTIYILISTILFNEEYIFDRYASLQYMEQFKEILTTYIIPKLIAIILISFVIIKSIINIKKHQQPFLLATTTLVFIGCRIIPKLKGLIIQSYSFISIFEIPFLINNKIILIEIIIEAVVYLSYIVMFIIWYRFNSFQRKKILKKGDEYETN